VRQASWNELFGYRHESVVIDLDVPEEPRGWRRLLWWEDLVTFALLAFIFGTVVVSVDRANWSDEMPTLATIALAGLLTGALLARIPWPEGIVHLLALPLGAAMALAQILAVADGPSPVQRFEDLTTRMGDWFSIAFGDGISNDDLPFIVLVVPMAWLAAYLSAWAVFRWRNAWLALAPGGSALLLNISFLEGELSLAFVLFVLGGTLLVTRLHLLDRAKRWRSDGTPYPPFLSLTVLHATFWVAVVVLSVAWLLPRADEQDGVEALWEDATAPVEERIDGMARLFLGVNNQGSGTRVHSFEDILPFLGGIELPDTLVAEIAASGLDQPRYLRSKTFDIYSGSGWRLRAQQQTRLPAGIETRTDALEQLRREFVIELTASIGQGDNILTVGQPQSFDQAATLRWLGARGNVTSVESERSLRPGDSYEATGSISGATEAELRTAGVEYPDWVRELYLQLPNDLPERVPALARSLTCQGSGIVYLDGRTAGTESVGTLAPFSPPDCSQPFTPYDKALSIEENLRQIPYDLDIPDTPPGQDTIDYFLFDLQRGYFDYHASAMVVLLRSVGIPSRLAVGYVLQADQREGTRYLVTEENAYAWPEVYFPGLGWVEFNPTPILPKIARTNAPAVNDGEPGDGAPPGVAPPGGIFGGQFPEPGSTGGGETLQDARGSGTNWWLIGLASGFALALTLASGASYAWLHGLRSLSVPARLWEQTVRLASWARVPPAASQTPREYADTLRARLPGVDGIDELADAYVRQRFGARQIDALERNRLETAWRAVRGRLLRRMLRLG
jgi:hypothetical protein